MFGLDTIALSQDGRVVLHRMRRGGAEARAWETATIDLPPSAVDDVLEAIRAGRVLGLSRVYSSGANDGAQWVLWIRQGDWEKVSYFDNSFPGAISRFAADLDRIVARSVGPDLRWVDVPASEARGHERGLWNSVDPHR